MPDSRTAAIQYAHQHRSRFLQELDEFLRFPSISTDPEHAVDIRRTAEWVAGQIKDLGFKNVQVMPTQGYPVVYGEYLDAGEKAPTVLVYGH